MFWNHYTNLRIPLKKNNRVIENKEPYIIDLYSIYGRNRFSYKRISDKKKYATDEFEFFNIYFPDDSIDHSLYAAIKSEKSDAIIKSILEEEDERNFHKGPVSDLEVALCFALQKNSKNIVEILLDAGGDFTGCFSHESVIHCYLQNPRSGLREDMLDLLLQRGPDRMLRDNDKSLMCFALSQGADVNDIKLLLRHGVSLNNCRSHDSAMLCLTCTEIGRPIKERVVKLLHDLGAQVNAVDGILGFVPLEHALRSCKFEIGAIKLLLDLQKIHSEVTTNKLLRLAVANPGCKLETVKFLVSQGIPMDNTALHYATMNNASEEIPSIINFLVEKGCPINGKDSSGFTPLRVAARHGSDYEIFMALLAAGANVGRTDKNSILWYILRKYYDPSLHDPLFRFNWFELCLKFAYLQNKNFDLQNLILPGKGFDKFCSFGATCMNELQRMEYKKVGHGRTLREFAHRGFFIHRKDAEVNHSELNQLLGILKKDSFPLYHEVIAARVSREAIVEKLNEISVCSVTYSPGSCVTKKVALNYACVCKIAKELHIDDLLSMAAAFYVLDNKLDGGDKTGIKRPIEKSVKLYKRTKMDYNLRSREICKRVLS